MGNEMKLNVSSMSNAAVGKAFNAIAGGQKQDEDGGSLNHTAPLMSVE